MSPESLLDRLETHFQKTPKPSVSLLAEEGANPFQILCATLISLRTKDPVTLSSSRKLFRLATTPGELLSQPLEAIEQAIYPGAFYKVKAERLKAISGILKDQYQGKVPSDADALLALPGVGIKTAALVRVLSFGIPDLCVDTHVHRIANRLDWVRTEKPEETESSLKRLLQPEDWLRTNELMVLFGSEICRPISPICSRCPVSQGCPQRNVTTHR